MSRLSSGHNSRGEHDPSLRALLEMNGDIYEQGGGHYIKIHAYEIPPDAGRPEGIDYSLTLHNPSGDRLLGYDNAHPVKISSGPAAKRNKVWHHVHREDNIRSYKFTNTEKLLDDFFSDVDKILIQKGVNP